MLVTRLMRVRVLMMKMTTTMMTTTAIGVHADYLVVSGNADEEDDTEDADMSHAQK
jgi:hypothetical protein